MTATRSIPWLRVFVEGVVIVGSILLAFGIQAWWEGLQESELERQAVTSLLQEVGILQGLVDRVDANHRRKGVAGQYLIAAIAEPEGRSGDSIAAALHEIDGMTTLAFQLSSFDLLVNSGNLDVLTDRLLAGDLVTLNALLGVYGRFEETRGILPPDSAGSVLRSVRRPRA